MSGHGYRLALAILRNHLDWPDAEVASIAGCSVDTVARAREALEQGEPARVLEPEAS